MSKHPSRRGYFFTALAGSLIGLLAGVLLVSMLPATAATGDPMVVGAVNKSGRSTWLSSRGYSTLKLNNTAGGLALDLRVLSGTAPLAVNSKARVPNLNADLLDGRHASAFLGATAQATDSDLLEGRHGAFYRNASNINAGTLSTDRFDAYGNLYYSGWLDNNHGLDLLTRIQADNRYINNGETAASVDGFDANDLVRIAHTETTEVNETAVFGTKSYGDILSTTIVAPAAGLLFIVASADSDVGIAGDLYYCQLHVNNTGVVGTVRWVLPASRGLGDISENCSTNGVKEVAAGTHTVDLHIEDRDPSVGALFHDASLQVLFVPFGAYGNQP